MSHVPGVLVAVAVIAVALVVAAGFANLFMGGGGERSQQLMRWRIGLQFAALLVILAVLFFRG